MTPLKITLVVAAVMAPLLPLILLWPNSKDLGATNSEISQTPAISALQDTQEFRTSGVSPPGRSRMPNEVSESPEADQVARQSTDGAAPPISEAAPDLESREKPVASEARSTDEVSVNFVRVSTQAIVERERHEREDVPYGQTLPESRYLEIRRERGNRFGLAASAKYLLQFNDWPGRNSGLLGGLRFDPADNPLLVASDYKVTKDELKTSPGFDGSVWTMDRQVEMANGDYRVSIRIAVHMKVGWAHEALLAVPLMMSHGIGSSDAHRRWFRGDEVERPLGDVSLWDSVAARADRPAGVYFCRNNVFVHMESRNISSRSREADLDLYELARQIDQQILAQAHAASSFDDLASKSPKINVYRRNRVSPARLRSYPS